MTIDGIIIAVNRIRELFGNLKDITGVEYYKDRIIFKTAENWYAYNLTDGNVTIYTEEGHKTYLC